MWLADVYRAKNSFTPFSCTSSPGLDLDWSCASSPDLSLSRNCASSPGLELAVFFKGMPSLREGSSVMTSHSSGPESDGAAVLTGTTGTPGDTLSKVPSVGKTSFSGLGTWAAGSVVGGGTRAGPEGSAPSSGGGRYVLSPGSRRVRSPPVEGAVIEWDGEEALLGPSPSTRLVTAGEGVASEGVTSEGATSDGVFSDGVTSDGVFSDGVFRGDGSSEGVVEESVTKSVKILKSIIT